MLLGCNAGLRQAAVEDQVVLYLLGLQPYSHAPFMWHSLIRRVLHVACCKLYIELMNVWTEPVVASHQPWWLPGQSFPLLPTYLRGIVEIL